MLTERFDRALGDAARLHRDQRRKVGGAPYVSHLLAVAALVLEDGGDEDEAVAALFHDALEDQGGETVFGAIAAGYGDAVASMVVSCTDTEPPWDPARKPPWLERKRAHLARLASPATPVGAIRVTAADKLHNVRCLLEELHWAPDPAAVWAGFNAGPADQLWYEREISRLVSARLPGRLAGELARSVDALAAAIGLTGAP